MAGLQLINCFTETDEPSLLQLKDFLDGYKVMTGFRRNTLLGFIYLNLGIQYLWFLILDIFYNPTEILECRKIRFVFWGLHN